MLLTVKDIARTKGFSIRRVQQKIKQGHFPSARKCECKKTWFIEDSDLNKEINHGRQNKSTLHLPNIES